MAEKRRDPEVVAFERDVAESIRQARRGEHAVVHTPETIARKRGRPVGSKAASAKVSTTIRLSPDLLEHFKAGGEGWQTRINDALREWVKAQA